MSIKKAEKKVLNNIESRKKVFRAIEPDFPCVTDSFVSFISDTLIKIDTAYKYKLDTINSLQVIETVDTVFVNKVIRIKDSTKVTKADLRRLDIALDSVGHYKGLTAYFKVQFEEQTAQTKEQKYLKNKWMLRFWLLLLLMLGIFALYLWLNK